MAKSVDTGGGKYVKLGDGDSMEFAIVPDCKLGQEVTWWLEKPNGERVIATAETAGAKESVKIAICVYDVKLRIMRYLRLTPPTFAKLGAKLDRFGEGKVYSIERGKGKNGFVEYTIDHVGPLTAEQSAHMASIDPIDVLAEKDVIPMPRAETEVPPAPAPKPAPKPSRPAALPQSATPAADDDVPFSEPTTA